MTLKRAEDMSVRSAVELTTVWGDLMGAGGFARRSLWMIFIESGGALSPVICPIDDIPSEPDELFVGNLAKIVAGIAEDRPCTTAFLLTRPGPTAMTDADRRWARAIHGSVPDTLSPWPVHLATAGRVQVFAPDDLIE